MTIDFDTQRQILKIEIADSGVGIAPEHHQLIFNPFRSFRNSASYSTGNNVGLGLSQSRDFARLLGGDLTLKESLPGKGSCFQLWIAAQAPDRYPECS